MKKLWLSILFFFHICFAVSGNLYSASVVVQDREHAHWQQAVRDALSEVLVKVSGNKHINTLQAIQSHLNHADP